MQASLNEGKEEDADIITSRSVEIEPTQAPIEGTKELNESTELEIENLEQWNKPRINVYRYLAALYSFVIMGMNDAAYGVRLDQSPNHLNSS